MQAAGVSDPPLGFWAIGPNVLLFGRKQPPGGGARGRALVETAGVCSTSAPLTWCQAARQNLDLEPELAKTDRYNLLILKDLA